MRKLLLLLGAARYPRRRDLALPAFPRAHAAFKAAMIGGASPIIAPNDCLDLFDDDGAWVDQQIRIDEWLNEKRAEAERPEALLLYYVGHGGIEKGEQVYLTINSTNQLDPYYSSVPRDSLAKLLRVSATDYRKFMILDCCFAARIIKNLQSAIQDKMTLELREVGKAVSKPNSGGLAALCASSSLAAANADGRDGLTQFTDGLLSALRIGDVSSPSDLSFETVRALLERQLHERYGAEAVPPSSYFADDFYEPVHQLPLFPNRAERPPDVFSARTHRPAAQPRGEADARLQMATGNPTGAGKDPDNYLLVRPQFAASFNCARGRPNWVSWHLRFTDFGQAPRTNKWTADPLFPAEAAGLSPLQLKGSGFHRGHLCPPGNRSASEADNRAVFQMSNIVAQSPLRNEKLWLGFEKFCRQLVEQRQCDLFVTSGPTGTLKTIADGRIEVPAALWKVVLCVPEGHVPGAQTRIAEVIAIRMSNHERAAISDWTEALVTVSAIEDETGYTFFDTLAPDVAALLKRRQVTQRTAEVILALTGQAVSAALGTRAGADQPAAERTAGGADIELFDNLRAIEARVASAFRKHQHQAMTPAALQALARPIEREAVRLTHLGIVDEFFGRDGDQVERDAGIFMAAVIIYKRQERQFLPRLLELASDGHPVRGAVMWRVLRAIRRIAPQGPVDDSLRAAIGKALANCARAYDSPAGHRFQGRDIVLLIAQATAQRGLKLDLVRDGIFTQEQMAEWEKVKAQTGRRAVDASAAHAPLAAGSLGPGPDDEQALGAAIAPGRKLSSDLLRPNAAVEAVAEAALRLRGGRMLERMIATALVRRHDDPLAVFKSAARQASTQSDFEAIAPWLRFVEQGAADVATSLYKERVTSTEADSVRMRVRFLGWSGELLFPSVDWEDKWCKEKFSFYYARSYLHAGWTEQPNHALRTLVDASIDANERYASYYNYEIQFLDWLSSLKGVPASNSRVMLKAMIDRKAPTAMITALLARIAVDPARDAAPDLQALSSHDSVDVRSAAMVALGFIPARSNTLREAKRSTFTEGTTAFAVSAGIDLMNDATEAVNAMLTREPVGSANYHAAWALGRLASQSPEALRHLTEASVENPDKLVRSICIAGLSQLDPKRSEDLIEAESADARDLEKFCLCLAATYIEDVRPLFRLLQSTGEDRIYVPNMLPCFQIMFRGAVNHASQSAPFLKSIAAASDDI